MRSGAGLIRLGLSIAVCVVFVVLWGGAAWAWLVDPGVVDEFWAWLTGLPTLAAVVAWILLLPIAVGAWAWQADLPPLVAVLVGLGLVAWTWAAVAGLVRALRPAR